MLQLQNTYFRWEDIYQGESPQTQEDSHVVHIYRLFGKPVEKGQPLFL